MITPGYIALSVFSCYVFGYGFGIVIRIFRFI